MTERKGRRGLGTGLGALFGDDVLDEAQDAVKVALAKVEPRAEQPRQAFDGEALQQLADSIKKHGIIQPITVRKLDSGFFQIIAGERRWRAARLAGLSEVPVRILEADDKTAMELALVENLQREDLNPIEEAKGYQTLMQVYGLTQEETAQSVGKSRPTVANALRLLGLVGSVLSMVEEGEISAGHARALLALRDEDAQIKLAGLICSEGLSVRQTEKLAARTAKLLEMPEDEKTTVNSGGITVDYIEECEKQLTFALGRKVAIKDSSRKGKIELEFYGSNDREALIQTLMTFSKTKEVFNEKRQ